MGVETIQEHYDKWYNFGKLYQFTHSYLTPDKFTSYSLEYYYKYIDGTLPAGIKLHCLNEFLKGLYE